MIIGEVTPNKEAVVSLTVQDAHGQAQDILAVIDTGFTEYLTLPKHLVDIWQLPFLQTVNVILADGSRQIIPVHVVKVSWNNQILTLPVYATEGGPLIGMSLLYGSSVNLIVLDGGKVTIEPV